MHARSDSRRDFHLSAGVLAGGQFVRVHTSGTLAPRSFRVHSFPARPCAPLRRRRGSRGQSKTGLVGSDAKRLQVWNWIAAEYSFSWEVEVREQAIISSLHSPKAKTRLSGSSTLVSGWRSPSILDVTESQWGACNWLTVSRRNAWCN